MRQLLTKKTLILSIVLFTACGEAADDGNSVWPATPARTRKAAARGATATGAIAAPGGGVTTTAGAPGGGGTGMPGATTAGGTGRGTASGTTGQGGTGQGTAGGTGQGTASGTTGQGTASGTTGQGTASGTTGQGTASGTTGQGTASGTVGQATAGSGLADARVETEAGEISDAKATAASRDEGISDVSGMLGSERVQLHHAVRGADRCMQGRNFQSWTLTHRDPCTAAAEMTQTMQLWIAQDTDESHVAEGNLLAQFADASTLRPVVARAGFVIWENDSQTATVSVEFNDGQRLAGEFSAAVCRP